MKKVRLLMPFKEETKIDLPPPKDFMVKRSDEQKTPFDFQIDAINKTIDKFADCQSLLGVSPTGSGKTVIFLFLLFKLWEKADYGKVGIMVHRKELLKQIYDTIPETMGNLEEVKVTRHGFDWEEGFDGEIVLMGADKMRFHKGDIPNFTYLIVDEAHHYMADTYLDLVRRRINKEYLFGTTATPFRNDNRSLRSLFNDEAFNITIDELVRKKRLVEAIQYLINTNMKISNIRETELDYKPEDLGKELNTKERNAKVVRAYKDHFSDKSAIVFNATVEHALAMNEMFNHAGFRSAVVHAKTKQDERDTIVERLKDERITVLNNVMVATEGWDIPILSVALFARPVKSKTMLFQMCGRVRRIHTRKEKCHLVAFRDIWVDSENKKPALFGSMVGLDNYVGKSGDNLDEIFRRVDELSQQLPQRTTFLSRAESIEEIEKIAKVDLIELIRKFDQPSELDELRYPWVYNTVDGVYMLNNFLPIQKESHYIIVTMKTFGAYANYIDGSGNINKIAPSFEDWEVFNEDGTITKKDLVLWEGKDDFEILKRIESDIIKSNFYTEVFPRGMKSQPWRNKKASGKQIDYLKRMGIENADILSAGEASLAIGAKLKIALPGTVQFGKKYRGWKPNDVPDGYVKWLMEEDREKAIEVFGQDRVDKIKSQPQTRKRVIL